MSTDSLDLDPIDIVRQAIDKSLEDLHVSYIEGVKALEAQYEERADKLRAARVLLASTNGQGHEPALVEAMLAGPSTIAAPPRPLVGPGDKEVNINKLTWGERALLVLQSEPGRRFKATEVLARVRELGWRGASDDEVIGTVRATLAGQLYKKRADIRRDDGSYWWEA